MKKLLNKFVICVIIDYTDKNIKFFIYYTDKNIRLCLEEKL